MILAFGSNGQLARSFKEVHKDDDIFYSPSTELDLLNTSEIIPYIESYQPSCIINFSAYNNVDDSEKDDSKALKINFEAVSKMAQYSSSNNIPIIHFSSDYVFDGQKESPYCEEDECGPINKYGMSKFLGERAIIDSNASFLIFRTSFLYSTTNISFPQVIKNLLDKNTRTLHGAKDIITSPTYSGNLAAALSKVLPQFMNKQNSGIYHFSDAGTVSRFEFINELVSIFRENDPSMLPIDLISVEDSFFNLPAKRPKFSSLLCQKILIDFDISQKDWTISLKENFLK